MLLPRKGRQGVGDLGLRETQSSPVGLQGEVRQGSPGFSGVLSVVVRFHVPDCKRSTP